MHFRKDFKVVVHTSEIDIFDEQNDIPILFNFPLGAFIKHLDQFLDPLCGPFYSIRQLIVGLPGSTFSEGPDLSPTRVGC